MAAIFPKAGPIVYSNIIVSSNKDMSLMMLELLSDLDSPVPTVVSVALSYLYDFIKWVLKLALVLSFYSFFFHSRIGAMNWEILLMIFVAIHRIRLSGIVSLPYQSRMCEIRYRFEFA